jgi:hypothetical protein
MRYPRFVLCRLALLGLLASSGCLIGFDPAPLTGGAHGGGNDGATAPAPIGDAGGGPASGPVPDNLGPASRCYDFSTYAEGAAVPNWVDGRGTWRTVVTQVGTLLGQTDSSSTTPARFVTWEGMDDWTDAGISAVITISERTDEVCVALHVQDADNFHALCLEKMGRRGDPPTFEWRLQRVVGGSVTTLANGGIDGGSAPHTLTLRAKGPSLTPSIDASVQPSVTDGTLTHGSVGLTTNWTGRFGMMCVVRL